MAAGLRDDMGLLLTMAAAVSAVRQDLPTPGTGAATPE